MFKPKLKDTQKKIIFLTWKELNRLREFKIPPTKQALERVCDVFLVQCFTGLRYSDVFNLRRSDIKGDHIDVTTFKTSDSLIIELNDHSKAILEKYKDVEFGNALALGIPPQVVMKWTGHSDYKAMKPYIDIADDIKASAMSKFNQL